jgi:hypothetical protein
MILFKNLPKRSSYMATKSGGITFHRHYLPVSITEQKDGKDVTLNLRVSVEADKSRVALKGRIYHLEEDKEGGAELAMMVTQRCQISKNKELNKKAVSIVKRGIEIVTVEKCPSQSEAASFLQAKNIQDLFSQLAFAQAETYNIDIINSDIIPNFSRISRTTIPTEEMEVWDNLQKQTLHTEFKALEATIIREKLISAMQKSDQGLTLIDKTLEEVKTQPEQAQVDAENKIILNKIKDRLEFASEQLRILSIISSPKSDEEKLKASLTKTHADLIQEYLSSNDAKLKDQLGQIKLDLKTIDAHILERMRAYDGVSAWFQSHLKQLVQHMQYTQEQSVEAEKKLNKIEEKLSNVKKKNKASKNSLELLKKDYAKLRKKYEILKKSRSPHESLSMNDSSSTTTPSLTIAAAPKPEEEGENGSARPKKVPVVIEPEIQLLALEALLEKVQTKKETATAAPKPVEEGENGSEQPKKVPVVIESEIQLLALEALLEKVQTKKETATAVPKPVEEVKKGSEQPKNVPVVVDLKIQALLDKYKQPKKDNV